MKRPYAYITLLSLAFFVYALSSQAAPETISQIIAQAANGGPVSDLQKNIEEKSSELQKIQTQRDALEKTLKEVSQSGNSLKKDIQIYNTNINHLDLSIKANSVTIEKLGLEINSLGSELGTMDDRIFKQKDAIRDLLSKLQQHEQDSLFSRIMRSETLSESVAEAQNITTLNGALNDNIKQLRDLQNEYSTKIELTKQKKINREVQKNNLVNLQQITQEQKTEKQRLFDQTKEQELFYQQQLDELDKKQEEINAVIEKIEYQLRSTFDPTLLPLKRPGVIDFPVDDLYITQCFGQTKAAMTLYRTKTHNGVDFGSPVGTPVLAVEQGKIIKVGNNDRGTSRWNKYQYGKYIVIQHGNNLATLYGHLSKQIVKEGDTVNKGDIIGYSGNTGYSKGPHLHLTVFWAPSIQYKAVAPAAGLVPIGITLDPTDYLPSLFQVPKAKDAGCKV
ncbi:MAG: peptidoglycan DD-metalloendopeptidase family protein [Candidatus Paceibacterota bacterium]|jgi:murein DD-endopeptidase MepM/ murein hydrolase activator NlpD